MSAVTATGATARRMVPAGWRQASLRLVPTPGRRAPRAAFVAIILMILGAGLVGLLLLTTAMQQRAFTLFDLQYEIEGLREERQLINAELAALEAPSALAESAARMGMVPNDTPAFLDLETGKIRGELVPAPWAPGGSR